MKATRYSSRYIQEMGLIEVICNYKKRLAPRVGLEPTIRRGELTAFPQLALDPIATLARL